MKTTKFAAGYQEKLFEALLSDARYTYVFDTTTGIIEDDIISRDGTNYTKLFGLTSPCHFDEIIKRSFHNDNLEIEYTLDSAAQKLSCEELLKAYEAGKNC